MRLDTLFGRQRRPFALEVFPPKRHSAVESVYGMLDRLGEVPADYVSVTYSAGGNGAKEYTAEIARYLKHTLGVEPLAHLTCYGASSSQVQAELDRLKAAGVENILALRGDPVPGVSLNGDYAHASDLIRTISNTGGFYIVAACYPEGHPESPSMASGIARLAEKLNAGAGHLVSQLFFDNVKFFRFLNDVRRKGIDCPVEAGVMPIVKYEQIARTVSLSSASLPSRFTRWVSRYADDPECFFEAGIEYAIGQIRALLEGGADGIHLYTMNNPEVARRIYDGVCDQL